MFRSTQPSARSIRGGAPPSSREWPGVPTRSPGVEDSFAPDCYVIDCHRRATHWDLVTPAGMSPEMSVPLCGDHDASHVFTPCAS